MIKAAHIDLRFYLRPSRAGPNLEPGTMEHLPHFNIVDLAVMVLLLLGLARGAMRGLSGELSGLISAGAALFAGWSLYRPIGDFLFNRSRLSEPAAHVVAFFAALVGGYLLMKVIGLILRSIMEFSFRGRIERVGGALAGFSRSAVVLAVILLLAGLWPSSSLHRLFAEESVAGRTVYRTLGPAYESLAEKHPALRIPGVTQNVEDGGEGAIPLSVSQMSNDELRIQSRFKWTKPQD
jgi:uncharacterized membrane protein required for colicin V production